MTDVPDARLLEEFVRNGSEEAFAALVQRHVALVHSVAMRHTANPQLAEDITQAVFILLARKASGLGRKTVLAGWLYHTARLTAANLQRAEMRRVRREQEAFMQSDLEESPTDALWRELSPQLDGAMASLGTGDRDALVLRYFQNKSMAEVGQCLGLAENTAQKRIGRALEKLRRFFAERGVHSTTAVIAGAISMHSVKAVPEALGKSVTAVALAKGAAASSSTLTLIKGALKVMAWTKAKTAVVAGAVVLLAVGTTTVTVQEIHNHKTYPWQVANANSEVIRNMPPQVGIAPAKYPTRMGGGIVWLNDGRDQSSSKGMGVAQPLERIVSFAYGQSEARTVFLSKVSSNEFDFIANLPSGNEAALQKEIERKFSLTGKRETRDTDVLVLQVRTSGAGGIKAPDARQLKPEPSMRSRAGSFICRNQSLSCLDTFLEGRLKVPVVDQTGLKNQYDIDLKWDESDYQHPNNDALERALSEQLGLELVSTNMPVEILVVR
ncbi:MAG TPA: TIGR03435 family protein [Verrucomicrobiae bacterium]|nr:TIGR03435 family protein [Verrucomicrobiae bacterium]